MPSRESRHAPKASARRLQLYFLVSYMSIGVFLPYSPPWLEAQGFTGFRLGLASALRPLLGLVAPVFFGWLADRFGWRGSILKWASAGALLAAVMLLFGSLGASPSYLLVLVGFGLFALFRTPMGTIADVAALEHPRSYGSLRLWGSAGFAVTSFGCGRWLSPNSSWQFPAVLALSLGLALVSALPIPARLPTLPPREPGTLRRLLLDPVMLSLLVLITLWAISHVAYDLLISLHLRDLGGSSFDVGLAWTLGVMAEITLMGLSSRLLRRSRAELWLLLGLLGTALRWVLLSRITSLGLLLVLQPLHAISFAMVWIAALDLLKVRAPASLLATAQGAFTTAVSLGSAAGMFLWSPWYHRAGAAPVFFASAGFALIAALTALVPLRELWRARRLALCR